MSFTATEVEDILNTFGETEDYEENYDDYGDIWSQFGYEKTAMNVPVLGEVTVEDSHMGDGDGSEMWLVIRVGDQLFRKTGRYSSWGESGFDGTLYEVEPYTKSVTFYRQK